MFTLTGGDRHAVAYGTFQETGFGWWNDDDVATTLRTPCGGDATKANLVVIASGKGGMSVVQPIQTYQKVTGPLMANSHPGSYTGQDAFSDMLVAGIDCRNFTENSELYPTLQAKPNGGQSLNYSGAIRVRYIVRRLTPTECARLQGFADRWGDIDKKEAFTDEEYLFWKEVRNTHAEINGKTVKEYTKDQMLKWYNGLHTDSSEYKMWGNGIALPCALYVMQGIEEAIRKESTHDSGEV
jgi:DNA (cytosine-5)-methyltransferase 1